MIVVIKILAKCPREREESAATATLVAHSWDLNVLTIVEVGLKLVNSEQRDFFPLGDTI